MSSYIAITQSFGTKQNACMFTIGYACGENVVLKRKVSEINPVVWPTYSLGSPFFLIMQLFIVCTIRIALFQVEKRLKELENADNADDLLKCFKSYGDDLMKLAKLSGLRQAVSLNF